MKKPKPVRKLQREQEPEKAEQEIYYDELEDWVHQNDHY